jgi:hypothetical protein
MILIGPNQYAAKPEFNTIAKYVEGQIGKRRSSWTLSTLEWDDARQLILIRAWQKYSLYDPARAPFEHWLNRLITNAMNNLLRDHLYKTARPCIKGCVFNDGGTLCSWTANGTQCDECPLYARWMDKKGDQFNVGSPISIENYYQDVKNTQCTFLDIEGKKKIVDKKVLAALDSGRERKMYRLLYIKHLTPMEVAEKLRSRPTADSLLDPNNERSGYQVVLNFQKKAREIARNIILSQDLL